MDRPSTPVDQPIVAPELPPVMEMPPRPMLLIVGDGQPFQPANAQASHAYFFARFSGLD